MLLNNQEITEENQRGNQKIPREQLQQKHGDPKPKGCSNSSPIDFGKLCFHFHLLQGIS